MRSVIITGVSRGIGAALFRRLHDAGDRILALGRHFSESQVALADAQPDRVRLRQADLRVPASLPSPGELASFVQDADEVVLIHNAGMIEPAGAVGALRSEEIFDSVMVNLASPILLTNALLAVDMPKHSKTSIAPVRRPLTVLYISSRAAHQTVGGFAVYGATKRGSEVFFEALAAQHADDPSVRVANVDPGAVDTAMQGQVRAAAASEAYFPMGEFFVDLHRSGQLISADEVAAQIIAAHLA
jgi:benzil reductase ((S)-benzoin forming)